MKDWQPGLSEYALALADDELILGHRASQWCGRAPILEEDIAFANLALDEIGHAGLWYGLYAGLTGQDPDTTPDRLIYRRPAQAFRCAPFVELDNGDWAFTMLRQFLFDCAEVARLAGLVESSQADLAAIAAKIIKEERYHLRHTRAWVERLGQGTIESHRRMRAALQALWPYTPGLFDHSPDQDALAAEGLLPPAAQVREAWLAQVLPLLQTCGLEPPEADPAQGTRDAFGRGRHHVTFPALIAEMQSVARLDPEAEW